MGALIYSGDTKLACGLLYKPSSGFKYPGGPRGQRPREMMSRGGQ